MSEVGRAPGRTKHATLRMLKRSLGKLKLVEVGRERLIQFGRTRAAAGAGPVTVGMDIGVVRLVLTHAAAVHGLPVAVEPVDLARVALTRLGLVGKQLLQYRHMHPIDEATAALAESLRARHLDARDAGPTG